MYEQMNNQFLAMGKNFADATIKAHSLALESFERIADLQLKAFESQVNATVGFWSEAAEVRDFDAAKAFWPKSVQMAKSSAEKLYSTGQEVFGVQLKTSEAIGEIVKGQIATTNQAVNEQVNAAANAVKKAATTTNNVK